MELKPLPFDAPLFGYERQTEIVTADPAEVSRHLELWLEASSPGAAP